MSTIYKGVRGRICRNIITPDRKLQHSFGRCERSRMTQERLAEKVGTRKSNISRLESGRYNPSLDFLEKVAGGLGREIEVKVT